MPSIVKNQIQSFIALYTERLNNIKENVANEIDHMNDYEIKGAEQLTKANAEFIGVLKSIDSSLAE